MPLLAVLVIRWRLSVGPFPVMAKFSLFHDHYVAVDRMIVAFIPLQILAVVLLSWAWWRERRFRVVQSDAWRVGSCFLTSVFSFMSDPVGYVGWFWD